MFKLLMCLSVLVATALPAHSQQVADGMSCAQATAAYAKDRRIQIMTRGGTAIPLYGWSPIAEGPRLQCHGRSQFLTLTIKTKDDRRCAVAVRCR